MIRRRLEFLKAVRFGRYVLNELVWWASCEGLHRLLAWAAYIYIYMLLFSDDSMKNKSVIQCRLDFSNVVRGLSLICYFSKLSFFRFSPNMFVMYIQYNCVMFIYVYIYIYTFISSASRKELGRVALGWAGLRLGWARQQ